MKILFYDCFAGISGDMNLAALLSLGIEVEYLKKELQKLPINKNEYNIEVKDVISNGISAKQVHVHCISESAHNIFCNDNIHVSAPLTKHKSIVHRTFKDIKDIIIDSTLADNVKKYSLAIFEKIAIAESKIHNVPIDKVHFHEVGSIDSIVDIVGAAICIDYLKPDKIVATPIELGGGMVSFSHGVYPVPAPATAEILKGVPVTIGKVNYEATTPTGAAIISSYATEFVQVFSFIPEKIGYGAGHKLSSIPNVLRVIMGRTELSNAVTENAIIIECNIDDMNPEIYESVINLLLDNGAQDVYLTPIFMKKLRPAQKLSVLCKIEEKTKLIEILLQHTSTLGVREYNVSKTLLNREIYTVDTKFGKVRVKKASGMGIVKLKPEYDDCLSIAQKFNMPVISVMNQIQKELNDQ